MKNRNYQILLLLLFIIHSCDKPKQNDEISKKNNSKFKVSQDYSDFSNRMENGDTLSIIANLSVCMWEEYDIIEFTKTKGKTYIQIKEKVVMNEDTFNFPKKLYKIQNDKIGLKELIKDFDIHNTNEINSPFYIISNYKENDTILLRTSGLTDRINKIEKYQNFISDLYPREIQEYQKKYQTPPPLPPSEKN